MTAQRPLFDEFERTFQRMAKHIEHPTDKLFADGGLQRMTVSVTAMPLASPLLGVSATALTSCRLRWTITSVVQVRSVKGVGYGGNLS